MRFNEKKIKKIKREETRGNWQKRTKKKKGGQQKTKTKAEFYFVRFLLQRQLEPFNIVTIKHT